MQNQQPGPSRQHIVELYDPEEEKCYQLNLNDEDHKRALKDPLFAQSLLKYAKNSAANSAVSEVELCNEPEPQNMITEDADNTQDNHDSTESSNAKLKWDYEAVKQLLQIMQNYLGDLKHPKKKKSVFENVSNELLSASFIYTADQCQQKWKSLTRTYKTVKDQKAKTGRGASRFFFFEDMDALLGNRPENSCDHAMQSSDILETDDSIAIEQTGENDVTNGNIDMEKPAPNQKKRKRTRTGDDALTLQKELEAARQKRHDELLQLEKEKLELEKRKVELLEKVERALLQ